MEDGAEGGTPHGRGNKPATRERAEPKIRRRVRSKWRSFREQSRVLASDSGIDFVITGIGGGKSAIAALKLLRWALRHPRRRDGSPTKWCVLGSDFKLVRMVQLEAILEQARRLSVPYAAIVKRVCGGQEPRIELWNGATIYGFSGTEPDRMRGHAFDGVWMDESEFQPLRAFAMALQRQRAAEKIRLVVTSSPDVAGWLWQVISGEYPEWDELRRTTAVRVHRWGTKTNTALKGEVLTGISAGLEATSPGSSRQEFDGLFLGTREAPGTMPINFEPAFVGRIALARPQDCRAAALGIDIGETTDFTWMTVLSETGIVLAMTRFNLSTVDIPRDKFYEFLDQAALELVERWRVPCVMIDLATTGRPVQQSLMRKLQGRNVRVDGINTASVGLKTRIVEGLGVALSRSAVKIPSAWTPAPGAPVAGSAEERSVGNVETLRLEFKKLQVTHLPAGTRKFTHPPGGHDDGVVSLALAYDVIATRPKAAPSDYSGWSAPNVPGRKF